LVEWGMMKRNKCWWWRRVANTPAPAGDPGLRKCVSEVEI